MRTQFRLLPLVIFFGALTLSVKLGGLWLGFHGLIAPSVAVAQEPATEAKDEPKGALGTLPRKAACPIARGACRSRWPLFLKAHPARPARHEYRAKQARLWPQAVFCREIRSPRAWDSPELSATSRRRRSIR